MDLEDKIALVKKTPTEEVVTESDLRTIFETYNTPKHYIGFEISGRVHLGTGLCTMLKLKDFQKAGIKTTIFLADYHSYINEKLGGDLETIQKVAKGYFKEAFLALGIEAEFILASEFYDNEYWKEVLKICKNTTIKRMLRCTTIMGRKEGETNPSSYIIYPAMQVADIFMLDVQMAHAGMDQRKVHMLARELSKKPFVAVHHSLLPSLQGTNRMDPTEAKMSKSKPHTAIFIDDSPEEIRAKLKKAYCPPKEENPVLVYAEYLILRDRPLKIERPEKFGGDVEFSNIEELKKAYFEGELHPLDLKAAVAEEIIRMTEPAREYMKRNNIAFELQ